MFFRIEVISPEEALGEDFPRFEKSVNDEKEKIRKALLKTRYQQEQKKMNQIQKEEQKKMNQIQKAKKLLEKEGFQVIGEKNE